MLETEIEKRQLDRAIHARTKKQMDKHQREYYLNEQIKAIHRELGRKDEKAELDELKKKIEEVGMTAEAKEKALQEISRLEVMPPMSAENTVSRTYIEWLINVPWKARSEEVNDLNRAEEILNEDHYGLAKIKERILEFSCCSPARQKPKRYDSLFRRRAGRRKNLAWKIDRSSNGTQVRSPCSWRGSR